ncbi:hypothetical protein HDC92_003776 [Pedobacter sp. AK017]|uniref:FecR family protein n=1 Tax=Pedobacter sp. AK017 TaxID=2723073 RepID=UPI0016186B34|nr:FecR family protein [Pedobacter sp. AK017]MBB5440078.1 hypothetical protein [Pedobacter sp. AK017]
MDHQRIIQLAQKFVDGSITAIELEEFNRWYYSDEGEQYKVNAFDSREALAVDMFKNVIDRAGLRVEKPKPYKLWPGIAVAVAVATVIFGAGLFYFNKDVKQVTPDQVALVNDVAPGVSGATLTLGSGKKIRLSDASSGELAQEAGVHVSKSADGKLVYEVTPGTGVSENLGAINTLSTDKGETYQLKLPDGTMVWLNAASSLKYAANLLAYGKRKVTLQGEAYFQVAKDKAHPFIVESGGQQVEVLGTEFNVNAYRDERVFRTTLLEGSVKLSENGESKILVPGMQATNANGRIRMSMVDTELAVAWKNNKFIFDRLPIEEIMRMIARWYNVEVIYQGEVPSGTFWGSVSRYDNISKALMPLEAAGGVHFKIEGRKIYVLK